VPLALDPPTHFVIPHAAAHMMRARMVTKRWLQHPRSASPIRYAVIGAVLFVTAGMASPSSASESKNTPTHPITTEQAAKQFLADDAPFASARTAYGIAFASWEAEKKPFSATNNFVEPFVKACKTFAQKLVSQHWPRGALSDARVFARSLIPIENDVNALPSLTRVVGARVLAAKFARDTATSLTDSNTLRGVLDIPPVSN
jgi:hypothetical protein